LHVDEYFAGMRCHPMQKVLVHPAELIAENDSLRATYRPNWSRPLPDRLFRLAARLGRIFLKSIIGGYSSRPPAALTASLQHLHDPDWLRHSHD
jgi:hypothetical protein